MVAQPIETAPKDGTKILIHEPSQGGWIEAHWEEEIPLQPFGVVLSCWMSDHHCEWFSKLKPDLWCHLPEVTRG